MLRKFSERAKARENKKKKIRDQLYQLLLMIVIPLVAILVILLILMTNYVQAYSASLQNANIASEFNVGFKKSLDLMMYEYSIDTRETEMPMGEIENAEEILSRLEETTVLASNKLRIKSMKSMCVYLRKYIEEIRQTESYSDRMKKLESNIYTTTRLFQTYMHDYIYDEVQELTKLQSEISNRVSTTIIVTIAASFLLVSIVGFSALRFTNRITNPINKLCGKIKRIGKGDFSIDYVETNCVEITTLDNGFNDMVIRINRQMEKEKENQISLHRAELELLQAQINPHFMYNTLDSIIWLAETQRHTDVIKMVTSLSVFFRTSLSNGENIIDIEVEQDQVKSYLEIQKIRYNDILEYEIDIPESLLKYKIPKLTLQPLVENAIYHGIKHRRAIGKIVISGYEEDDAILLQVKDNGIGMNEEQLEKLRNGVYKDCHTGLGLINVYKRIKNFCGEEYGLFFDSKLTEGTTVTARLSKEINGF